MIIAYYYISYIYDCQGTDASFRKRKWELIHPLEKMVEVLSLREDQAVIPSSIKLLLCSPCLGSLGAEMGKLTYITDFSGSSWLV